MIKPSSGHTGDLATYTIYSNGTPISNSFMVISIHVHKAVNCIGTATLVIDTGSTLSAGAAEMDSDVFIPGKEIRIDVGYAGDNKIIYEGVVSAHSLQITEAAGANLRIECRDYAFPATLTRKNNVFKEMKDSDIIGQLLYQYPMLHVAVDATSTTNESLVQYYSTDWDFILSRAEANGLLVISDGKSIKVIKPDIAAQPAFKLTYGSSIIAFNGTLDSAAQTTSVNAVAWDAAEQQIITVSGDVPAVNSQGNITPAKLAEVNQQQTILQTTTAKEPALKSWADATWFKSAMGRYKGTIKFQGIDIAVPGCMIGLSGLGARFDGNAYVGAVVHEIAEGNWHTTATMGISPENVTDSNPISVAPASGLLAGMQGLQVGKVISLDNDPTGEDRIQVEIPLLNGYGNKIWARLATFWAGNDMGAFFIPDAGDEVVLGFFNDNPSDAVVLGSLYSSYKKAPYSLTADNHIRGLVSKSKIKVVFDEEKKSLTFSTPGHNVIEISDDSKSIKLSDQNNNKITLSASGIAIDSDKSIVFNAKSGIEINAGNAIDLKGKSGITMKAANIEATADGSFKAKGSATAELSASGPVTIKGAMVTIN